MLDRKRMVQAKNPLVSQTPVMSGMMRDNAPPETPSMYSQQGQPSSETPLLSSFNLLKPQN